MTELIRMDASLGMALLAAMGLLRLLGQVMGGSVDPNLASWLGNAGIVGVLIWFLYYQTSVAEPKRREAGAAELKAQRDDFTAEIARQRISYTEEHRLLREHYENENAELRQMVVKLMDSTRVAVHDVRDAVNTAVLKSAIVDRKT